MLLVGQLKNIWWNISIKFTFEMIWRKEVIYQWVAEKERLTTQFLEHFIWIGYRSIGKC